MVNHYATPPDAPGGTRHYDFARELTKHGNKVTIFTSSFSHRTRKEERLKKGQNYRRENINGVEFVWLRTSPYYGGNDWRRVVNMLSYSFRVVPPALKLKEKPDVILASSPHPFAGLAGWLLAKFKKAAFIFEVRDLWPLTFVEIGGYSSRSPVVKLLDVLEKFLYRRARKIIVLLPKASDYITGLGIPANKIVYIPNGVSPELFSKTDAQLPKGLRELISNLKSRRKLLVGYAGAHGIANDLETILEAAKLFQDEGRDKPYFLLVGDGPEKERLITKTRIWGLSNTSFHRSIPKNAMPWLLRSIDIAVISMEKTDLYRYGMSPNKLWDYMACCKPIVRGTGSANDPIAQAKCGITVPQENAKAIARAILKLCDLSDKERQEMGKRGYEYVMKHHSVPVLAKKLLEVMEDVKRE